MIVPGFFSVEKIQNILQRVVSPVDNFLLIIAFHDVDVVSADTGSQS